MTHAELEQERKQVAVAVANGETIIAAAARFKTSTCRVRMACHEFGITWTRSYKGAADPFAVLAKLKDAAFPTDAAVALACGLSRERVRQIKERAREFGLLTTTKRRYQRQAKAGKGQ